MEQRLVTIAQYQDLPSANIAQAKLESQGIISFLDNEYTIGMNWLYSNALGGVKLNVPEEFAKDAILILNENSGLPEAPDPEAGLLSKSSCPKCGSTEIESKNFTRKFAALTLLLSLPLFFFLKRSTCRNCGYVWK